ncbi:hypothetical protein [Criblamydia sequanensis]|uniref:Conserved putative secreted protein n=1 Tax=Candidatus Criblamydia sequanensis CRIB-18 TaxID=1437425 RepID=A0A090CZZ9_9BACT|nr:hypothetical protein [Criblamydia sequanensis]CDR32853.1 Conserved putative secreted protein [Criblamydia sequanensis CRIB-18]
MLHHFRKYQQYIYLVVTVVIIISFSFFGTAGVIDSMQNYDEPVFKTTSGTTVKHRDLNEMALFISTDKTDSLRYQGYGGPNFLNDGVIANDFLKTGLAYVLLENFKEPLKADLESRAAKEKHFNLYTHKEAPFISVENTWNYFAKDMAQNYRTLKKNDDPLSEESFKARVSLYNREREFPYAFFKQFLRYQQAQYSWVKPDRDLEYQDLALFNYHTFDDWFGPRFIKLISAVILNASDAALKAGYHVSKEEALAELKKNAAESFKEAQKQGTHPAKNVDDYFQEELRRLGLDKNQAVKLWQKVLLFRRYINNVSRSVFVSSLPFNSFTEYATEGTEGELFTLKKELKFDTPKEFELFEIYLSQIQKIDPKSQNLLLKDTFKTPLEVAKEAPALVETEVKVEYAEVDTLNLMGKITLKDTWNWESQSENWPLLVKEFPELGLKKPTSQEERVAALDELSSETRSRVDYYAKKEILKNHPEWVEETFASLEFNPLTLHINMLGESSEFPQIEAKALKEAIDALKTKETSATASLQSKDKKKHFQIRLLDKSHDPQILTFNEAKEKGVLETILNKKLKSHYEKIRETDPKTYKGEDGNWKSLAEVEFKVADSYFAKVLSLIQKEVTGLGDEYKGLPKEVKALYPYRFLSYMKQSLEEFKSGQFQNFEEPSSENPNRLESQFKIVKTSFKRDRRNPGIPEHKDLQESQSSPSKVFFQASEGPYFFVIGGAINPNTATGSIETALSVQELIGNEALRNFFEVFLHQIKEKQSLESLFLESENDKTEVALNAYKG